MKARAGLIASVLVTLLSSGHALAGAVRAAGFKGPPSDARVVVIPPSVQLAEISAGGTVEPRADWTAEARGHVMTALGEELQKHRLVVVHYVPPTDGPTQHLHMQLFRLHVLVARAVLRHHYSERFKLPNKGERFDWTLGTEAASLGRAAGAEYALFTEFADAYATGGRVALNVAAALFGGVIAHGRLVGIASLVDLPTGDIVWFNFAVDATGDLRRAEPARQAVHRLFSELPE